MLVDSHCHLDFPDFAAERDAIVERAKEAGVDLLVTISTRVHKFPEIRAIAERYDNVFCSVGTHPHHADKEPEITAADLVKLTGHPKVVAIGEAGLDYFRNNSSVAGQQQGFRRHIAAARETGLPLVIHAREADGDMANILEEESAKGSFPFVLHCFTGGEDLARRGVALGGYVSFSGVISFKKNEALRAIAASIPQDRILVETDAPFLAPEPFRGKRNEPAFVTHTAKALAAARNTDIATIEQQTTDNFFRLFSKVPKPA